jgi:hypothetical protein
LVPAHDCNGRGVINPRSLDDDNGSSDTVACNGLQIRGSLLAETIATSPITFNPEASFTTDPTPITHTVANK